MPIPKANNRYVSESTAGQRLGVFRAVWQRSFLVTLFFLTLAALLFWLDAFRAYESEVRVLVIGKSQTVATDQAVENLAELSQNLSFYERVLSGNDLINDDFAGYSKDKRKALWQETVTVKQSDGSGVLVVTARQATAEQAKRLSEATVKTLFATTAFYYNIKTDIDLRVVDEPIVKTVIRQPLWYVLSSLGSALAATTLFFTVLSFAPLFLGRREPAVPPAFPLGASVPFIDPQKFIPARPVSLSFESTHEEQLKQAYSEPVPDPADVESERMLPGMETEELPFQFEDSFPEEDVSEETVPSEPIPSDLPVTNGFVVGEPETPAAVPSIPSGEPSIEEYKRRLNELLSGGK